MSTAEATAFPTSSPVVAGKFELVRLLGRGGMGSVWEGKHMTLGTRVAIKFVETDFANSAEARQRFETEAHAVARLQSRYAIKIFDHGITDDGKPFIVMEFLTGETLDQRLQRFGRLTLPDVARIIAQVSKALQRAHDEGIIHRDLKPENIFIAKEDDEEVAKVLDFGIAKMKEPEGGTSGAGISGSTKTGAVLGTPFYMSPEQARGLRGIDHRTDMWSLGVIVYRCLVGELPFGGQSVGDLLVNICTAPIPVPSQRVNSLPQGFDQWFARTVIREPTHRFPRAQELADALLAVASGAGIPASGFTEAMPQVAPAYAPQQGYTPQGGHPGMYAPQGTPRPGSSPGFAPGSIHGAYTGSPSTLTPGRVSGLPDPKGGRKVLFGILGVVLVGGIVVAAVAANKGKPADVAASTGVPNVANTTPTQVPTDVASAPIPTTEVQPLQPLGGQTGRSENGTRPGGKPIGKPPGKGTSAIVPPPPPPPPGGKTTVLLPPPPPPPPPPVVKPPSHSGDPGF